MNISQPNSHFSSPSPCSSSNYSFSQSPFEDIAKCNQHKFWKWVTRGLKRYFTCLKPMKSRNRDPKTGCNLRSNSPKTNCNYYSEMNNEERAERLRSAIVYCKDSFLQVKGVEEHTLESEPTDYAMIPFVPPIVSPMV